MFLNHHLAFAVYQQPEDAWSLTDCELTEVLVFIFDQANVLWKWGFEERFIHALAVISYMIDVYETRIRSLDDDTT